jgi:predicted TIM-barrel fold metal-dependent hydrolase
MKLGRFVVDTHVHAQRFAVGKDFASMFKDKGVIRYNDLARAIGTATPYDNSDRLIYDMECYDVDMCVLLPAFGMTNELNSQIVENYPERFVAVCLPTETINKASTGEQPWSSEAAAKEIDELLSTGRFVGIGEGLPTDHSRKTTMGHVERMDDLRPIMEVANKHKTVVRAHTGMPMGYPLTYHFWPESINPLWMNDLAVEYPDVPILLDHGGMQGGRSEKFVEEALLVAASNDNVYLETGLWWTELYHRALLDPNIGAEKLVWGCDWGASLPFHTQYGNHPPAYAVQIRKQPVVNHQVDVWGWSTKQLLRLDISQDDLNLIIGGNAARLFGLKLPHTRLFRPVGKELRPQPGEMDLPPICC